MRQHLHLKRSDFYTLEGRIGRLDLFAGLLIIVLITVTADLLLYPFIRNTEDIDTILLYQAGVQGAGLCLATPLYVKRFHDLNSSGWWVMVFWIQYPFTREVTALLNHYFEFTIVPYSQFIFFAGIFMFIVVLVLLFKAGNPDANAWGAPLE